MRFDLKPVSAKLSPLAETAWHEYAVRFFFGGLVTALAGMVAKKYGASAGGLFLAFPAIFPASATLIEKHEQRRKVRKGFSGVCRARQAVATDAAGAALGSTGLIAFALVVWQWLPDLPAALVIGAATLAWGVISGVFWVAWKRKWLPHRAVGRLFRQQRDFV